MKHKTILILLFIVSQIVGSMAQDLASADPVCQMFEKPQKIKWVKHYKGRLDDMNDVAVTLACDGKKVKGEMQYLRSKVNFFLVGELKKDKIVLQEYDEASLVTGYIKGDVSESGIRGNWQNIDNSIGATLLLEEVKQRADVPGHCADNKWIRFYKGNIGKDKTYLNLQKNGAGKITGTIVFPNKGGSQNISGHQDVFDNVHLKIKDQMANPRGRLEGTFDEKKKFNANYIKQNNREYVCTFNLEKTLPLGCSEYADYVTSYDVLYPKTKHEKFNKWIKTIIEEWNTACKKYAEDVQRINMTPKPVMRKTLRAHGWSDVDILNKDLISGQLYFFRSWEEKSTSRNLNYDFKNDKEILASDIFQEDFDYQKYVKKYLRNRLLQHKLSKDDDFRKWLDGQTFNVFSFRREGIYFATDFHPIYGRQEVTIPYKKLKPFLVKNHITQNFLKGKY